MVMNRRQFLRTSGVTLSAAALGAPYVSTGRAQGAAPIRIGLLAPLTGVVASGGREMVEGTRFWFEQIRGEIAGRKVELVIEDDASNPDMPLQKARRLVEQGNCHMLIGDLLANTGLAVANYVKGTGTPYFIPIIAADDLTQRQRIKNVIRVAGYSASAFTHPFGDWALKQATGRSRPSARITPSATNNAAVSPRSSPKVAAKSCSSSGIRSTRPISAHISASLRI